MMRKKQGSLSNKIGRTISLTKCLTVNQNKLQQEKKMRLPSTCLTLMKVNQFIQQYHILKQQFNFNSSSQNMLEQQREKNINDRSFCFDIDLGVQYVQSQHLDSGFQFQEKNTSNNNIPKVSSGKEIFTSILEINKTEENQLQDQNFTDQQEQEQGFSINSSKNRKFGQKSRKQLLNINKNSEGRHQNQKLSNQRTLPLSLIVQKSLKNDIQSQSIVHKLKLTAQFRKQKIKYWNNSLFQLQRQNVSTKGKFQNIITNQQNVLKNMNSHLQNTQELKNIKSKCARRSKFQKQPINNKEKSIKLKKLKNKQNEIPIKDEANVRRKFTTKQQDPKFQNNKKIGNMMLTMKNNFQLSGLNNIDKVKQNQPISIKQNRYRDKNLIKRLF